jgi:hypothetical protein
VQRLKSEFELEVERNGRELKRLRAITEEAKSDQEKIQKDARRREEDHGRELEEVRSETRLRQEREARELKADAERAEIERNALALKLEDRERELAGALQRAKDEHRGHVERLERRLLDEKADVERKHSLRLNDHESELRIRQGELREHKEKLQKTKDALEMKENEVRHFQALHEQGKKDQGGVVKELEAKARHCQAELESKVGEHERAREERG